ncbi:sodium-dependent dicarboxylate transporter SdcS [Kordia sp. SMS9]|uniref:SLC13 family permease n=1 Tax=Kordia sp. SMS9 TaxID=2282170 RepID=UPI000E0D94F2|nr:SLC13 family permease [Kordia sp. SMS9]AXG69225.1 sodium-dependent dicarboxylate transporter SdcS [Kordia sp. SMS9]
MYIVLVILVITIALFVWGKFTPDIVALMSMLSLFLTGILDLQETLSGFSNATVIMIASLFIIGEGLSQTGWTALAGQKFVQWAGKSVPKLLVLVSLGSGVLSGFVSNTGTVATLLPVSVSAAWSIGTVPSKILMPVAFGSNTGGLLTLTGTPPNIIASNALAENGFESFSFFEFALIGLPLLIISILYFRYVGFKILPKNTTDNQPVNIDSEMHEWIENYSVGDNIYRLRIRSMSPMIDTNIGDWKFEENNLSVIRLRRRFPKPLKGIKRFVEFPTADTELRYHDIITVKGSAKDIDKFVIKYHLGILPFKSDNDDLKEEFINQEVGMAEMIVTPNSIVLGRNIPMGLYLQQAGVQLLGASRNNKPLKDKNVAIKAGDAFVIRGTWERIEALKNMYKNIVISGSPESMAKNVDKLTYKSYISLGMLLLMIFLLVFKIVPGAIAAMISAGFILITGCVPMAKAYKGISWISVVMIAAMIPMGLALQKTGVAALAADSLVNTLGSVHPIVLLSGIFLLTTLFSQAINNSATAVLMAPIAIIAAQSLGISPEPFMIVVAISASTAFLTPVGTTTNAMVMSAGDYKFMDYVKVGAPLLLIFFIVSMLLVPLIWPF